MSSQQTEVTLESKTDQLQALTHTLHSELDLSNSPPINVASMMFTSKLGELRENDDYAVSGTLSQEDTETLIRDDGNITTENECVKSVSTVDQIPTWLDATKISTQTTGGNTDTDTDTVGFSYNQSGSDTAAGDDLTDIGSISEAKAKTLRENGIETFDDICESTASEIANFPGIQTFVAQQIHTEAELHRDKGPDIATEAYESERQYQSRPGPVERTSSAKSHRVADVNIPAGEPRGEEYGLISEPVENGGLAVLELPTLTRDILLDIAKNADTISEVTQNLDGLVEYDRQFNELRESISEVDSTDALVELLNPPYDTDALEESFFFQPGATEAVIEAGIAAHSEKTVAASSPENLTRVIDREFDGEMPVRARINVAQLIHEKLDNSVEQVAELTEETTVEEMTDAAVSEVQLDHPFIESPDEFPPIFARELATGKTDVEEVTKLLAKNNSAVDLIGHAGVGKDTILRWIAAKSNRPSVVINMDESMISQDLMGMHQVDENGEINFKLGVLPHSAKYGYMLVISEVNAAPPEILTALHQALERNGKVHVKEEDEIIEPSEKFRICFTRNPVTQEYNGVKELNGAFKRRLTPLKIPYLDLEDETTLIDSIVNENRVVLDRSGIKDLVSLADTFRNAAGTGDGLDSDINDLPRLSTTELLHVIDLYDGTGNLVGAAKETIGAHADESQYTTCMQLIEDELANWSEL